ncbi:glycosyltransferase [Clostridium sp. FAM 1755]|uniref:glycosyltransferase n=1 Tax=Clostridium caseinilyticum TaxID=3350403 RepID=UPI0038F65ACF
MGELEQYKKKVKKNIETLINSNNLEEAKNIIKEYEKLVKSDVEIYSFKSIIMMMEGNMAKAESILKEGILIDEKNFDLLYNLAYLYKCQRNYIDSYKFYKMAKKYIEKEEINKEIEKVLNEYDKLDQIKKYNKKLQRENLIYPKVTIVITTYNQKEHLKEAIESCLRQDYPNLEVLVIDDCSQDGTDVMMKGYNINKKVRYIRNKVNLGAGNNTYNIYYKLIDSEYALTLNHDDYFIKNNYISRAVNLLIENTNLSFVWANCKIKNEISGEESFTNFKNDKIINGMDYFINYETEKRPHIVGQLTTVFNVKKLRASGYGKEKTKSKDTFQYLKLMLMGDVGFIDDHVSVYRVHKKSLSFNMPKEFDLSTIQEFEKLKDYVLNKKMADGNVMEIWINRRVYSYIFWRFTTLWNTKDKKYALKLLMAISKKYNNAYENILNSI